jgi:hypothetical protein
LIVQAITKNKLSNNAYAVSNKNSNNGKYYFTEDQMKSWKIWYCLDNDTETYPWASKTGKGVIYRFIDENNNDINFDFKSIYYPKNYYHFGEYIFYDQGESLNGVDHSKECYNNKVIINPLKDFIFIIGSNNVVIGFSSRFDDYNGNTIKGDSNIIRNSAIQVTIRGNNNKIENCSMPNYRLILNNNCNNNTIVGITGKANVSLGENSSFNELKGNVTTTGITLGNDCTHNIIQNSNTLGNLCYNNTITAGGNTLGNSCYCNTILTTGNTLGNSCQNNRISGGSGCNLKNNAYNNILESVSGGVWVDGYHNNIYKQGGGTITGNYNNVFSANAVISGNNNLVQIGSGGGTYIYGDNNALGPYCSGVNINGNGNVLSSNCSSTYIYGNENVLESGCSGVTLGTSS